MLISSDDLCHVARNVERITTIKNLVNGYGMTVTLEAEKTIMKLIQLNKQNFVFYLYNSISNSILPF